MFKIPFLGIALLASTFALPATAQDAMKKNPPVKPADPELKVVVDSWNDIGRKLTAMAEDFPEDKYDYKPTPAQRSFAEQLLHAAGANYYFINPVMGQKPPAEEDAKREQYKTKADVVTFVKKSFADGAAAIQSKGEKGLTSTIEEPSATRKFGSSTTPTAISSTAANTTVSSWFITASQAWSPRVPSKK